MNLIILGKFVIADPHSILEDAGVVICDDTISAVGVHDRLLADYRGYEVLDRRNCIIAPGFINSHMHSYGIISHGITPPVEIENFEAFLGKFWWPLVENRLDARMIAAAGRASAVELLESGVTAFCDILEAPNAIPGGLEAIAGAIDDLGIRAILSFEASERISPENGLEGLAENRDFTLAHAGHPRISGKMCIHTTFTCPRPFIRQAAEMARSIGSGIQMHLSESRYEPDWCIKHYGKLPVEVYEELGFLDEQVLASQGVKLTEGEIDILAARGVKLVHVPLSNCEVGGGFSPVPDLLARGVTVGLGTDGYINNFFEVMRGAFLLHKAHREDPEAMPAAEVYAMATEYGAKSLGVPGGRLEAGGAADVITIQADFPTPVTPANLFGQLILYRNPSDVLEVWVGGRKLKENGQLINVDRDKIRAAACREAGRLWDFSG